MLKQITFQTVAKEYLPDGFAHTNIWRQCPGGMELLGSFRNDLFHGGSSPITAQELSWISSHFCERHGFVACFDENMGVPK